MRFIPYTILWLLCCLSCNDNRGSGPGKVAHEAEVNIPFDREKWNMKEDLDYPFRARMLDDVLYNDTIRSLKKEEILELLGEPDRISEGHLYYQITQKRMGSWTLHQKSMVIKFENDSTIEWIKTHG